MPQDQRAQAVVALDQRQVAQAELDREEDLAGEVVPRDELADQPARRSDGLGGGGALALGQERRRRMAPRGDVVGHRDREVGRGEPEPTVETDVLHRAGHCLESQRRDPSFSSPLLHEPVYGGAHHGLADPRALPIRPHRERPHPPLRPGAVHDVERHHLAGLVAPQHRARTGVAQGVAPHLGVEIGNAHPDEPVPPVAVRERVREHPVQGLRVPLGRGLGAVHLALRQPRPHR